MGEHDGRPLPSWYDDAKLGIFVHWTAAAIPAFAPVRDSPFDLAAEGGWEEAMRCSPYTEWYWNSISIEGSPAAEHHAAVHGDRPYDDFVQRFLDLHAGWQPEPWVDLFEQAGARYVVLVTKHHDGVLLWPSDTPNPHKARWASDRDLVGELAALVRARGLRFGTYYSGGLDWTFGGLPMTDFQAMLAAIPQTDDYVAYVDAHWHELIERYRPDVLWGDIGSPAAFDIDGLFADYYAAVPDGVVNNRFDWIAQTAGMKHCDFVTPEYSTKGDPARKWESTRGIGTSFGFNRLESEDTYLAPDELIRMFVDIVAHGGNLLLNVGPTGDGVIPFAQAQRLLALGWWLRTNGDAIYGTRPWTRHAGQTGEGHEVRFTHSPDADALNAVVLDTPTSDVVELDVTPPPDAEVRLLGHGEPLAWEATPGGCRVTLPGQPPEGPAIALRITPAPAG
ncbi:MAG TPA: alpha-L-fucosidase [Acidimicrobiales bacterium]|nr:alpha-L-fucosidase [Acidimicrobiales bacterium]